MAKNERIENILILVVSSFFGAVGQLFYKYAFGTTNIILWIIVGLIFYFVSTLFYFRGLSRVHLSWAYGINGLSYIFATIFAATVLAESVPILRWIGVGVIFVGVILIGSS